MTTITKYRPYPQIDLPSRSWPSKRISSAPKWCSVDLRDGNQALITPMAMEEKLEFFATIVKMGFKEIEVGFPAAAKVEFDFLRRLIDEDLIPKDVSVQVLVQARKHLIEKTFEAIKGAKNPIVHLYNSTSVNQRKIVFRMSEREIIAVALQGVKWIKEQIAQTGQQIRLQYSPESFTGTELQFTLDICNSVIGEWKPTPDNPMILNLPATVELSTPNIYADMIEWISNKLDRRDSVIISLHTHNDRGTAVAATELGLLAGAQRVEGTLFGNGERTGNADLISLALNLYTQGIDPNLDVYDVDTLAELSERITRIPVHCRHPYAGSLVFTAFSGSHQDAINKGLKYQQAKADDYWEVPYLPIDPADLGRNYEGIIRINSQSGKGGIAYVLEKELGYQIPKEMQQEFATVIQRIADATGLEVDSRVVLDTFSSTYLHDGGLIRFNSCDMLHLDGGKLQCSLAVSVKGKDLKLVGTGNGPLDSCAAALSLCSDIPKFTISSYHEHALSQGSDSKAIAYIGLETNLNGNHCFGAGIDTDITVAAVKSLLRAINRCLA